MCKRMTYLMLVALVLGLAHGGWATTKIIIVTNDTATEASYTPFLTNLLGGDITVEAVKDKYVDPLSAAAKADLAAANLIIVSRKTSSGKFVTDIPFWNALATPILLNSSFLIGDDRWRWMPGGTQNVDVTIVGVVDASDLVFYGVPIADGQVKISETTLPGLDVSNQGSAGNGTKIATPVGIDRVMIARWAAGTEYYPGSGYITGGPRLFFGMRTDQFLPFVNDNGKKMLGNGILSILGLIGPATSDPKPANAATDVVRDVILSWTPKAVGAKHDVYLGTAFQSVSDASRANPLGVWAGQVETGNEYDPVGLLEFGLTYYWRVDEVNGVDLKVSKGNVWSFTIEPYAYPIKGVIATASSSHSTDTTPGKTIDGSGVNTSDQHGTDDKTMWLSSVAGPQPTWIQYDFDRVYKLHQMWVWNSNQILESVLGFGAKDVTVEYSTDGTAWTVLAGVTQFGRATVLPDYVHNTTVDFGGVSARHVRITIKSNWGGMLPQYGLSEVRFFYIPVFARLLQPASAATNVALDTTLSWRPGREAARHEVYLGTDPNAVRDAVIPVKTVTEASCSLASLATLYGRTYYWKVNEVNDAATPSTWEGDVWSFTTIGYVVVDDFEQYDDVCKRIFFSWIDGFGHSGSAPCNIPAGTGNGTGSTVGNLNPPFAERAIVHGGKQAMPLWYDNTTGKSESETVRTFDLAQDWTRVGARTLVVFFSGEATNGVGQLYVKINGTRVLYTGTADAMAKTLWQQWNIGLTSVAGNLNAVKTLAIGVSGPVGGKLYIDDIRLYQEAPEGMVP